jgi:ACS family tartrate transporter-like MFS transporter
MLQDLQMSEQVYALGGSIFFLGYFLFEVPSNLILRRTGARLWIGRIMISWGLISSGMMFVRSSLDFYLARFLLGMAEAGFFPGMILYLSYWFPARARARAVSRFMMASALTGIIGGPLSGALLQYTDGLGGLPGWQWLFLVEGLPSVLLGCVVLVYLRDRPEQAGWLSSAERAWLVERMSQEEHHRETRHGLTLLRALVNPRLWLLCSLYFTVAMGSNSFGLYLPKLIADHFAGLDKLHIGLLAAVPNLAAMVCMVLVGMHSDSTGERRWHVAGPAFVAAVGWFLLSQAEEPAFALLGLALAQMGMLSMLAPFWSLPTSFLSGAAAAGGIAMINSVGNLGGFVAPNVFGFVEAKTGSFAGGQVFLSVALLCGALLALAARHDATLDRG